MSDKKEDIVDITPDESFGAPKSPDPEPPKAAKAKPKKKALAARSAKEVGIMNMPKVDNSGKTPEFFARFNGKAPHYKLASTFSLEGTEKSDQDNCRLFTSWMKPKRVRLSTEWAEEMRAKGNLMRLELPNDES